MCDALVGTWKLTENNSDDFSKCMEEIGVIFMKRQAGRHLDPDVIISKNEDEWSIKTLSTSKNTELNFKLNEEFDEITAEGRKVKSEIAWRWSINTKANMGWRRIYNHKRSERWPPDNNLHYR
ncbi:fatty acid-binding protein, adipocyte-like isoform X4 [Bufo bufo]|uniref:fatty acid-binding protein, adipocyte-like isoform X4 n=1 Tax=Bufo bufo TaxID=8384 RepID=UPI001ABDAAE3|nr:fatty acid-binding protein, adipocyte-like isoform X4 [Bufo bufo]